MNDPLQTLLIARAQEIKRQELEELKLGSVPRRRRILGSLEPARPPPIGERFVAGFNKWRFMSGSAVGAAAMGVLAVTLFPNFETDTRPLTANEQQYAAALGETVGAIPLNASSASAPRKSTTTYERLAPNWLKIDPQSEASITDASGHLPLIVTIVAGDALEVISSDLGAMTNLQQKILSVDYSSSTRRGSIAVILTERLEKYILERHGVDLSNKTRQQTEILLVTLRYAQK